MPTLRARAYIDGFNLYYGALKGTPYKWLDLHAFAQRLVPHATVTHVTYCTARTTDRPDDPGMAARQDTYLRALAANPNLSVVEGKFRTDRVAMPRVPNPECACCNGRGLCDSCAQWDHGCACCSWPTARVLRTEEKGSDVNVAVALVRDGLLDEFDIAIVVSGDSDLQGAVDTVTQVAKRTVIVVDPRNRKHAGLFGSERRNVRPAALAACQLPEIVPLPDGRSLTRPQKWA